MKNRPLIAKGFTLIELVIVIVIVGILTVVAVPVYKGYTERAMATEAKALINAIRTAELVYYAENGSWYDTPTSNFISSDAVLGVDASGNKYFKNFKSKERTTGDKGRYASTTDAKGVIWGIVWSDSPDKTITVTQSDGLTCIAPLFYRTDTDGKTYCHGI